MLSKSWLKNITVITFVPLVSFFTKFSKDLQAVVYFTDYCLYLVSISRINPFNKRTNCLRRTGSTFWLLHHPFRKEKNMHSVPTCYFFPNHFAPCASTTSDCKEEMATTPGRDLYIAKNQKLYYQARLWLSKLCEDTSMGWA